MQFKSPTVNSFPNLGQGNIITRDIVNSEFVYYNAFKFNNSYLSPNNYSSTYGSYGQQEPAKYNENRKNPIITEPSKYKVAVSSFSLPASIIPMFRLENDFFPPNYPNRYTITLNLFFPTPGPNSVIVSDYLFRGQPDGTFFYTYDHVVDEINRVISDLFNQLVAQYDIINFPNIYTANPQFPQSPNFLNYDHLSDLFTWYAPYPQMNETPITPGNQKIVITFSNNLYQLFRGNRFFFDPNNVQSGNQYIKNTQQFSSAAAWFNYNKILLVSRQIGFRPENIGTDKTISLVNGLDVTNSILADFDIEINNSNSDNPNTRILYDPTYLHWIDMYKDTPLYNIDLEFYLSDREGKLIQLPLESQNNFNVKLIFARKIF